MRIPQVCLAVLQVIFTVGIARETMAETQKSFASQVPPIAPGTDETSRRDVVDAIKLLKDKDPDLRALGARLLAGFGENAAPAIPELIALLGACPRIPTRESAGDEEGVRAESIRAQYGFPTFPRP